MNIRDHITRKNRQFVIAVIVSWLLFAFGMFAELDGIEKVLIFIGFIGFIVSIASNIYLIKCPRCNIKLGSLTAGQKKSEINYCPNCGVNFDESM